MIGVVRPHSGHSGVRLLDAVPHAGRYKLGPQHPADRVPLLWPPADDLHVPQHCSLELQINGGTAVRDHMHHARVMGARDIAFDCGRGNCRQELQGELSPARLCMVELCTACFQAAHGEGVRSWTCCALCVLHQACSDTELS